MKYEVVTGWNVKDFTAMVQVMLDKGWVPQGGVTVTVENGGQTFSQALIKIEENQ